MRWSVNAMAERFSKEMVIGVPELSTPELIMETVPML